VVPVAHRATHRLIRQIDLVELGELIGDEALKKFSTMFQEPLAPKAVAVICAATKLVDPHIVTTASALAVDELATQVDAVA
jgi:hypothetical protein